MSDDYSADIHTDGSVAVGGSAATGEVETARDFDWFAVELVAGRTYVIDVEGDDTGAGTLRNTVLRGLYDADGDLIADTRDHDGGIGKNAQLTFTATETETHYIEARGKRFQTGTYTVEVTDETPDLGDITGLTAAQSESLRLDGTADAVTYRRFTLSAEKEVELELLGLDADADLVLEDIGGNELHASRESGTAGETLTATLAAGTYYVRVEAREPGANAFTLHYGLSTPGTNQAPVFAEQSYAFDLAENADGALFGIELGPVEANDTDNDPITYSIVGGDPDGLFFIEAGTGFLLYVGDGEDYESGTTHYELTVRASDGSLHSDVTVTVNVTDEPELTHVEPPVPAQQQQYSTTSASESSEPELTYVEPPVPAQQQQQYSTTSASESSGTDFPADSTTTGVVAVDGSATGNIGTASDRDWFAVTLSAGVYYRIDLEGSGTGALSDPELFGIYDANFKNSNNLIAGTGNDDHEDSRDSQLGFSPPQDGTYYVEVGGHEGETGDYKLSVTTLRSVSEPTDGRGAWPELHNDLPDDARTTGVVAVGSSVTGRSNTQTPDSDWFAVTLNAGVKYRFELISTYGAVPVVFGIYNYDADSDSDPFANTQRDGSGLFKQVSFTPTTTGTYYVAVGAGTAFGEYRLTVLEYEDDFTAGTGAPGALAADWTATGKISFTGDHDWFAVPLKAGLEYRIDVEGSRNGAGTLNRPTLDGIYYDDELDTDDKLKLIDNTQKLGILNDPMAVVVPEMDGTYYVAVGADGGDRGTYTLRVNLTDDDFADGPETQGRLEDHVDNIRRGEIDYADDIDWFAVEMQAGLEYEFHQTSISQLDPKLHGIYDEDGDLVGDGDESGAGGRGSHLFFTPTTDGTYYVAAGSEQAVPVDGEPQGNFRTGAYLLLMSVTDRDDVGDHRTFGKHGTVTVGTPVEEYLHYLYDRDWFQVVLEANKTYRIDLEGADTGKGTLSDPYLRLKQEGANGGVHSIAGMEDDDSGAGLNSQLTFTPTETDTYYLDVASAIWGAGGTYTLSVTEEDTM